MSMSKTFLVLVSVLILKLNLEIAGSYYIALAGLKLVLLFPEPPLC
jgi:hypothetical protein